MDKRRLHSWYVRLGRICYILSAPARWVFLSHTHRAYIVIEHDSRVLLVKNWLSSGEWSLPGGGVHGWERAEDGVRREVREELGIQLGDIEYLTEGFSKDTFGGKHYMLFHVSLKANPPINVRRREITEYTWVPRINIASRDDISEEARIAFLVPTKR